uniref:Chromosome 14 open reading frame 119 n=1 Tax=Seriola lalandi dorsalis TaxID=1841481 RepID=A0A3B4WCB8_SERLL
IAGQVGDPEPISYVTLQEQRCVLSWFQGWTATQRDRFLQDLLGKAVPGKVCTLLDSLNTLQVRDRLPNIFECQLRLWSQWFESWREEERNHFLHILEERDPVFVAHFYSSVAGTAGRD